MVLSLLYISRWDFLSINYIIDRFANVTSAALVQRRARDDHVTLVLTTERLVTEIVVLHKTGANLSFQAAQPGSWQMCETIVRRNVFHDETLALHLVNGTAMNEWNTQSNDAPVREGNSMNFALGSYHNSYSPTENEKYCFQSEQ